MTCDQGCSGGTKVSNLTSVNHVTRTFTPEKVFSKNHGACGTCDNINGFKQFHKKSWWYYFCCGWCTELENSEKKWKTKTRVEINTAPPQPSFHHCCSVAQPIGNISTVTMTTTQQLPESKQNSYTCEPEVFGSSSKITIASGSTCPGPSSGQTTTYASSLSPHPSGFFYRDSSVQASSSIYSGSNEGFGGPSVVHIG